MKRMIRKLMNLKVISIPFVDRMCLHVNAEEHELGDLGEPANYKSALLDPESNKWLDAMNVEMQSMKDNKVWDLVDLPPNDKTVGSEWLFKKKTNMDGAVHTYKARLVAKGFTQTYGVNYEENLFSYSCYKEIVKSYLGRCFAMKDLGEAAYILRIKIYRDRSKWLISLCQSAYIEKILKRYFMENSKRGTIPMQEKLKLSKSQGELHWTTVKNILKYLRNTKHSENGYVIRFKMEVLLTEKRHAKYFCKTSSTDADISCFYTSKKTV
ncbi:retrotransposon protein, putative, ty1-copia subclass [Tanacetum coccineum]